jgi:hypothetical protein
MVRQVEVRIITQAYVQTYLAQNAFVSGICDTTDPEKCQALLSAADYI